MKKVPIEIEMFGSFVHVVIGTKGELEKEATRRYPNLVDLLTNYEAFVMVREGEDPTMFLKKGYSLETLVHECLHASNRVLSNVGVKSDYYNDETQAYLTEYLFKQIRKIK